MSVSQIEVIKVMDAKTCVNGTFYSDSWSFRKCTGSAAVIVISTAGTLAISQQCSIDNVNWYDPIDISATAKGIVKAAQTVTTGVYVVYDPVLTEWARFKVVESTASTSVTLILIERVEV
jgi:hypothetical protein